MGKQRDEPEVTQKAPKNFLTCDLGDLFVVVSLTKNKTFLYSLCPISNVNFEKPGYKLAKVLTRKLRDFLVLKTTTTSPQRTLNQTARCVYWQEKTAALKVKKHPNCLIRCDDSPSWDQRDKGKSQQNQVNNPSSLANKDLILVINQHF